MRKTFTLLIALLTLTVSAWADKMRPQVYFDAPETGITLLIGQTFDAKSILVDNSGTNLSITWASTDEQYFTVDANGIVTPLKENDGSQGAVYLRATKTGNDDWDEVTCELQIYIYYPLYIYRYEDEEIKVSATNASDILGDGTLSYNAATHTITMNNCNINASIRTLFTYQDKAPLTINLVGTNIITDGYLINMAYMNSEGKNPALTISGSGSLTISGENSYLGAGTLTIDDATVNLSMATDDLDCYQRYTNYGVFWANDLSVINNGHFHATVTTNIDISGCSSIYTVGRVSNSVTGRITPQTTVWSNDPVNDISSYYDNDDYAGCFFDTVENVLVREVEIEGVSVAPAPVTTSVTWDAAYVASLELTEYTNMSYGSYNDGTKTATKKGITATISATADGSRADWNSYSNYSQISLEGSATLTFSSALGNLKEIIIYTDFTNGYQQGCDPEVWGDFTGKRLIWTGDAASVVLQSISQEYALMIQYIDSIQFTYEGAPVDPESEKEEIEFYYFDGWDPSTYQETRITEKEIIYDSWGYSSTSPLYFKSTLSEIPTISFESSDESVLEIYNTERSEWNDQYTIYYRLLSAGTAEIRAIYAGDDDYKASTTIFTVRTVDGKYYFEPNLVFKKYKEGSSWEFESEPLEHLVAREGDTIRLDLCQRNISWLGVRHWRVSTGSARQHIFFPWENEAANKVYTDRIAVVGAGNDTLIATYRFYEDEPAYTVKLPITILPLVRPVENAARTAFDFSTVDPAANENLIFSSTVNDKRNETTGELEISTTLSQSEVDAFMNRNAAGSEAWLNTLQGSLTINIPAGEGTLAFRCYANPGYEFKLKIRGQETVSFQQTSMDVATVQYNVEEPTSVVLYLATVSGSVSAPRRAPAAMKDAPNGFIGSLTITPLYSVAPKADPDNAGVYYSTFFNGAQNYLLPAGTDAYVATISGEDMNLNKVVNGGEVLPANTAVILKSTSASVVLTPTDAAAVTISATNDLHGVDFETAAPANCYVLSGHSTDNSVTGVGFYEFTGTIPAHKAYLTVSGGAAYAPKKLRFVFNNEQQATGVENVQGDKVQCTKVIENGVLYIRHNGKIYNAQGQIVK